MKSKIKPIRVEITSGEGIQNLGAFPQVIEAVDPQELWRLTQNALSAVAVLCGAPERSKGGYNKTDFKVVFEDGEEYQVRYDMRSDGLGDNRETLVEHIRANLGITAGTFEPAWWREEPGRGYSLRKLYAGDADAVNEAREALETYDIGDCFSDHMGENRPREVIDLQCRAFGLEQRLRSEVSAEDMSKATTTADCFKLIARVETDEDRVRLFGSTAVELVAARMESRMIEPPLDLSDAIAKRNEWYFENYRQAPFRGIEAHKYETAQGRGTGVYRSEQGECFAAEADGYAADKIGGRLMSYYCRVGDKYLTAYREPGHEAEVLDEAVVFIADCEYREDRQWVLEVTHADGNSKSTRHGTRFNAMDEYKDALRRCRREGIGNAVNFTLIEEHRNEETWEWSGVGATELEGYNPDIEEKISITI